jgi:DNA-binding IclR family transcriptional regulator
MPVRTERTITDSDALLRDLELSAARGYTIDDEEDSEGVFCVGAAIFDRNGKPGPLITHRFPLEDYAQAYQVLRAGSGPRGKVMLDINLQDAR